MKTTVHVERAKHGITQTQLADKVGTTKQTISLLEQNKTKTSTKLAIKIARFFRVEVEDLFIPDDKEL